VREIASGVAALHAQGVIHGDLKSCNIMLVRDNPNDVHSNCHAQIIDFGFTVPAEIGKTLNTDTSGSVYNDGYYGTIDCTAPELLGVINFCQNHYKVEAFALGYLMYKLYFRKLPIWGEMVRAMYNNNNPAISREDQKKDIVLQMQKSVSATTAHLPVDKIDAAYLKTCVMLLETDPDKRWSVEQALAEINRALANWYL
jgi:serine/threonine protein kinase